MRFKISLIFILVFITFLAFTLNESEKAFVGKWKNTKTESFIKLKSDNTMEMTDKKGKSIISDGKWSVESNSLRLKFKMKKQNIEITLSYEKVSNNEYKIKPVKAIANGKKVKPKFNDKANIVRIND